MMKSKFFICLSLIAFTFGACKNDASSTASSSSDSPSTASSNTAEITGIITYRDDSKIPNTADITIRLVDLSSADKQVVKSITFKTGENGKPFPFTFPYDADAIKAGNKYGLDADIDFVVASLYYTLEPIEVLSNDLKQDVTMILVKGPKPKE